MDAAVYIVTGFLESGKTKFMREMLTDEGFSEGERTLLLVCEEGEEEYESGAAEKVQHGDGEPRDRPRTWPATS